MHEVTLLSKKVSDRHWLHLTKTSTLPPQGPDPQQQELPVFWQRMDKMEVTSPTAKQRCVCMIHPF